jgi:hypothetical protein
MNLRVIKEHSASFDYNVVFRKGDTVKVSKEDIEMPGWFWCESQEGAWSWIPVEYLDIEGSMGTLTKDYDTLELSVEVGEVLEYVTNVKYWTLCRRSNGSKGWIPTKNLEKFQ